MKFATGKGSFFHVFNHQLYLGLAGFVRHSSGRGENDIHIQAIGRKAPILLERKGAGAGLAPPEIEPPVLACRRAA